MQEFTLPDGAIVIHGERGWELHRDGEFVRDLSVYEDQFITAAIESERERCALVCEQEKDRTIASAKFAGVLADQRDYDICIARIRAGQ